MTMKSRIFMERERRMVGGFLFLMYDDEIIISEFYGVGVDLQKTNFGAENFLQHKIENKSAIFFHFFSQQVTTVTGPTNPQNFPQQVTTATGPTNPQNFPQQVTTATGHTTIRTWARCTQGVCPDRGKITFQQSRGRNTITAVKNRLNS
jgi:hypothetical protein